MGPTPSGLSYGDYRLRFKNHFDTMLTQFCQQAPPTTGGVIVNPINFTDNLSVISPPTVTEPLFACARELTVRGAIEGAVVELYLNANPTPVMTVVANPGDIVDFVLPNDLVINDLVKARQIVGGVPSQFSAVAVVTEYPDPTLPDPWIGPETVYRCANTIQVITVPGAKIEAWQNGIDLQTIYSTGTGFTMSPGPTPWDLGDAFTVRASLCAKQSGITNPIFAIEPPSTLRAPTFDPAQPFEGQEWVVLRGLDYGAYGKISRVSPSLLLGNTCATPNGTSCRFSLPVSALGRPLEANERLSAEPSLFCPTGGPPGTTTTTPPSVACKYLPAPVVAAPVVGQNYISMISAMPGARIRVYDAANVEIADGAGSVIRLVPPRVFVAGDVITVVQQIGTCSGETGFRIGAI